MSERIQKILIAVLLIITTVLIYIGYSFFKKTDAEIEKNSIQKYNSNKNSSLEEPINSNHTNKSSTDTIDIKPNKIQAQNKQLNHIIGSDEYYEIERFFSKNPDRLIILTQLLSNPSIYAKCLNVVISWEALVANDQIKYNEDNWFSISTLAIGTQEAKINLLKRGFDQNTLDEIFNDYSRNTDPLRGKSASNWLYSYTKECVAISDKAFK